jgi:sensor histidine kinase YesM
MLLHTYCQNAIKHGISPKDGPGNVTIEINKKTIDDLQCIVVKVSDDGIGRKAAATLSTDSTKKGLTILMDQVALHNQTNPHPIHQHVTDLTDAEGLPAGTCYEMQIPVGYKYD